MVVWESLKLATGARSLGGLCPRTFPIGLILGYKLRKKKNFDQFLCSKLFSISKNTTKRKHRKKKKYLVQMKTTMSFTPTKRLSLKR